VSVPKNMGRFTENVPGETRVEHLAGQDSMVIGIK
jgi:hypothetical protein